MSNGGLLQDKTLFYLCVLYSFIKCGSSLTLWNKLRQDRSGGRGGTGGGSSTVKE